MWWAVMGNHKISLTLLDTNIHHILHPKLFNAMCLQTDTRTHTNSSWQTISSSCSTYLLCI